jgi:hypothetical protein
MQNAKVTTQIILLLTYVVVKLGWKKLTLYIKDLLEPLRKSIIAVPHFTLTEK